MPAAPRPERPPEPAIPDRRATEAVLLIVIVMNAFFMLAAFAPPLIGSGAAKPARASGAASLRSCEKDPGPAEAASDGRVSGTMSCRR